MSDLLLSPTRREPPYPLVIGGALVERSDGRYIRTETAALIGPVRGGDSAVAGGFVTAVVPPDGQPVIVYPAAAGGGGGGDTDVDATASAQTLPPGSAATATVTEPTPNLFDFLFGIPAGAPGAPGAAGAQGPKGDKGDTGATGATGGSATVPMDAVHVVGAFNEPPFLNGFAAQPTYTVGFRKDPLGKVSISGVIATPVGSGQFAAFILPAAYWPKKDRAFPCQAGIGVTYCYVLTDGSVIVPKGSNYIYLDPMEWDTETVTAMPTGPKGDKGDTGAQGPATVIPLVSALPSSPVDGQEVYYQSSAMGIAGTVWRLRYRAASTHAYKWEYVGGSALDGSADAGASYTTGAAYSPGPALATPQLTVPLAGEYLFEYECNWQATGGYPDLRALLVVGGGWASAAFGATSPSTFNDSVSGHRRVTATVGAVADLRILSSGAGAIVTVYDRSITARPIRVG